MVRVGAVCSCAAMVKTNKQASAIAKRIRLINVSLLVIWTGARNYSSAAGLFVGTRHFNNEEVLRII
jgi:hypothetical protein